MFKLYSKGCEYAIRALAHVAAQEDVERFQAHAICEAVGIPESFTRKVFQALVQGGFLTAVRGPGGGYRVAGSLQGVSILDVIHAVDGPDTYSGCIMGMPECSGKTPCPLHRLWAGVKGELLQQLSEKKMADLATVLRARRLKSDSVKKAPAREK